MEVERPPASYWKVLTGLRQAGLVEESEEIKAYVDRLRAGCEVRERAAFEAGGDAKEASLKNGEPCFYHDRAYEDWAKGEK